MLKTSSYIWALLSICQLLFFNSVLSIHLFSCPTAILHPALFTSLLALCLCFFSSFLHACMSFLSSAIHFPVLLYEHLIFSSSSGALHPLFSILNYRKLTWKRLVGPKKWDSCYSNFRSQYSFRNTCIQVFQRFVQNQQTSKLCGFHWFS